MEYTVTSFSEGRKGGQITVTIDEGRNRHSFTRHLHRQGGALVGLNIDERAIPLNKRYEDELRTAEADLTSAEAALKVLEKKLGVVADVDPSKVDEVNIAAAKAMLESMIEIATAEVATAMSFVNDAEVKLHIVRRELPLMMEFRRF